MTPLDADRIASLPHARPDDSDTAEIGVPGQVAVCFVCWEYARDCRCYADDERTLRAKYTGRARPRIRASSDAETTPAA
jgi:hypothetical protein